jgi:hypothetical protein
MCCFEYVACGWTTSKEREAMSEQEKQPHRISQEEYERELQQAEKSDDPRIKTTDYTEIDILSGEINSTATVDKTVKGTRATSTEQDREGGESRPSIDSGE